MTAPPDCPDLECWEALFSETFSPEQRARCERHLEACPACQARLDRVGQGTDALRTLVREVGDPAAPPDPGLSDFLDRMREVVSPLASVPADPADLHFLRPSGRPGVLGTLGGYQVQEVVGRGGMGIVLKAFDPALDRLVAIKVLSPALAASPTARRRFTREAQAAAAVSHNHVVTVHGVGEAEGLPYLVMQYVAGESLQARLDRTGPLHVTEVVRIGYEAASGLAAAHARGLVHRDIKPANLLLEGGAAKVKLTDFGLARAVDEVGLTQQGVVAGTPEYMAPEQARAEPVDHRADLFSLGSVLYACGSGVPPFRGPSTVAILHQVSEEVPTPLRLVNPDVPSWLEALVDRLLAKDPRDRIQSAGEVAGLLEGYLAHLHQPSLVPAPALPAPPAASRPRACPLLWHVLGLALGALLVALGLARWLQVVPAAGREEARPVELNYDFRGGRPLPPEIRVAGALGNAVCRPEERGFRITLAGDRPNPIGRVGLETKTILQGDFEITAGYEILSADQPTQGHGVGFEFFAHTVHVPQQGFGVYRMTRVGEGDVYFVSRSYLNPDGSPGWQQESIPTTAKAGRLRITRSGTKATAWAAEGTSDRFKVLRTYDLGPEEIKVIWLMAYTGHVQLALDLLVTDFTIRSGVPMPSPPPDESASGLPRGLWRFLAVVLGLLLAGAAGTWWLARRRGGPAVAAAPFAVTCPGCGKNLRARPELAGKKVKCPQCGKAVLVPQPGAGQPA
jgi:hypothetical protein